MRPIISAFLLLLSGALAAQHETLFGNISSSGAFGGPILEISSINGQLGGDVGGGGALVLDNFFIGGYGMGTSYPELVLTQEIDGELQDVFYDIRFKHGGLWFGYTHQQHKVLHPYTSLKIGWGQARLRHDEFRMPSDRIFVLTPEAGIEANLTGFFKLGITVGYRWVNGINRLPALGNQDFSSLTSALTFRFGSFGDGWR